MEEENNIYTIKQCDLCLCKNCKNKNICTCSECKTPYSRVTKCSNYQVGNTIVVNEKRLELFMKLFIEVSDIADGLLEKNYTCDNCPNNDCDFEFGNTCYKNMKHWLVGEDKDE